MSAGEIKWLEANHVGVRPPAAALEQKLIAKKVCKARVGRILLVLKDPGLWQDFVRIFDHTFGGNFFHFAVNVKMIFMPLAEERSNRQLLHHRKLRTDP
jgi:hypothetical protein